MSNIEQIRRTTGYYTTKRQMITDLGYKDPLTDTDERQVDIGTILQNEGFEWKIVSNYDCSDLGSRESPYYEYFQTRAPGEQELEEMYEDFYVLQKPLHRIPMGMYIANELFLFSGNKRMRTHEYALTKVDDQTGAPLHSSRCDVLVVEKQGMTVNEKLILAHKLARRANKQDDSVRDEKPSEDYPYQLSIAYKLHCIANPQANQWKLHEKEVWGKQWVINNISSDYNHESRASVLGSIVNSAFGMNGRGVSLAMPDDTTIRTKWKQFFGNTATWNPFSTKVTMVKLPTRPDFMRQTLYNEWKDRKTPSAQQKSCHLVVRAGQKLDSEITSLKTVQSKRASSLAAITKYNTNVNHVFAGFHIIRRVMYVKQMNLDDYEAWEWNEDTEEFDRKEASQS